MTFGHAPRPMFSELFGPLIGLDREWELQGATRDEIDMVGFDWDYVPYLDCGGTTGVFGTPEPQVLEETDECCIIRDCLGRRSKLVKASAILPHPTAMEFPVKNMDDWLRLKPYYQFSEGRIDPEAVEQAHHAQAEGVLVRAEIPGGWDTARELMGEVEACVAYYQQPELMQDILDTIRDTSLKVLDRITTRVMIDQLYVHEDMAGRNGPMIGPAMVRQYIEPYYRACWELLSSRGTQLFNLDSDGNMIPVIDAFLQGGINVMHPFDPAAGMDIVAVRQKYGHRFAVIGGIDKHVLRRGKEDIRKELEYKMQPMMRQGTIFGLDHCIPNGTPLGNYRYYVTLGREILGLPPVNSKNKGWGRMAF